MIKLFSNEEYDNSKSTDKLPLKCERCGKIFYKEKKEIKYAEKKRNNTLKYCSIKCSVARKSIVGICETCGKEINIPYYVQKRNEHFFCSQSCSAKYHNTHKKYGTRRSKLEIFIENKLSELYSFEILYNDKNAINSELDIYIPSKKIAFELNGAVHYAPIFGEKKFSQIKENDKHKLEECTKIGVSLFVIDTSSMKYFKENSAIKFLNLITEKIDTY